MTFKGIADRLNKAGQAADEVLEEFRKNPSADAGELAMVIKNYTAAKLELPDEDVCDNINIMVRCSVSRVTGIPVEKLKEMDRPGACGSAPTVLAKKILLFIDIQNKLGVKMPPGDAGKIQTVFDLAEELLPLMA